MSAHVEPSLEQRLVAAARTAAQRDAVRSPEATRAVLDRRARQLARPVAAEHDDGGDALHLLHVQVGDDRLAIPLASIVAIARSTSITPLPRAVAPVYGVTGWRGRPLTVLSLAPTAPVPTGESRLIVLGTGSRASLAVTVDVVDDVVSVPRASLASPGPGPRRRFALGITEDGVLVVDGDLLLHLEALSQ
ncbi:MAG: chemotaxis protein CheW [bacterium]